MYKLKGMIPAIPTPYCEDGKIDYEGMKKIMDHLIDGGMHSILVGGSTGEFIYHTKEERKESYKKACEISDGRVPIMAGTGCNRVEDTIELTQYASEVGVSSALVLPPFYSTTTDQGIIDYFKEVAEASDIGIVIYNNPFQTNVEMSPELIYEISKIDNVIGIKNTWDSLIHTMKIIDLTRDNDNFEVLTAIEQLTIAALAYGAAGSIGLIHNLKPKECRKIYDLVVEENDVRAATEVYLEIADLVDIIDASPSPGTVKAAFDVMGLPGGASRKPLVPADKSIFEQFEKVLK